MLSCSTEVLRRDRDSPAPGGFAHGRWSSSADTAGMCSVLFLHHLTSASEAPRAEEHLRLQIRKLRLRGSTK